MDRKKKAQKSHAKARAVQRYGITLKEHEYQEICKWIAQADPRAIWLEKQSLRVSLYAVRWQEQWLPVVYDKHRHSIASILPKEALVPYAKKLEGL